MREARNRPRCILVEFPTADRLLHAAHVMRAAGHTDLRAFSPFPVEGLAEALGRRPSRVAALTFVAGVAGGVGGFFMQWYSAVIDYPLNIGGRPLNSWPMFVPVTFELTVLCAALAAFVAAIAGGALPALRDPLLEAPGFELVTRDRFFLVVPVADAGPDSGRLIERIAGLDPIRCVELRA